MRPSNTHTQMLKGHDLDTKLLCPKETASSSKPNRKIWPSTLDRWTWDICPRGTYRNVRVRAR